MPDTVCFPVTELVNIDPMASVATAVWWCRLSPIPIPVGRPVPARLAGYVHSARSGGDDDPR